MYKRGFFGTGKSIPFDFSFAAAAVTGDSPPRSDLTSSTAGPSQRGGLFSLVVREMHRDNSGTGFVNREFFPVAYKISVIS